MSKRILVKLSGEGLSNKEKGLAIDPEIVSKIAKQIKTMVKDGKEVAVVTGGGNFWRGATAEKNGISRTRADYIGMLATIMNGLALQSGFEKEGIETEIQSAISIDEKVARNYVTEKAVSFLENGKVVIFSGGTGRPYFTTDTTAALVASEINAKQILMGKNGIDGIYSSDPKKDPNAKKFDIITYDELVEKGLEVMDLTAATLAKNKGIELLVFDINKEDAILKATRGEIPMTKVTK